MKLKVVTSKVGMEWVRLGIRTFMRRPLAITGLFFINLTLLSLVAEIPVIGVALALLLVPASTVSMMVAAQQAHEGHFPKPDVLLTGFRGGARLTQTLLAQGAVYAIGMFAALGATALADGGVLAKLYLEGGQLTQAQAQDPALMLSLMILAIMGALLSMVLWHAPALAYWHGVGAAKSLFFSSVACIRNFGAFTVYSMVWMSLMFLAAIGAYILAAVTDTPTLFPVIAFPAMMLISAMFITSMYFTFIACFQSTHEEMP